MKKQFISILLFCAILISMVPVSASAETPALSSESATEFLSFLSGNAFYSPKETDLYYSLLTGTNQALALKQSFLGLVYQSMNDHLYETRLNRLQMELEEDLPQTTKDATLELVSGAVKDELIESFAGIGDSGDIWEGFEIILNTVFFAFNVRGQARSAYFSAMLGIDPDDTYYELYADSNALLSGVGVDKDMVDEWISFLYAIEQEVLGDKISDTTAAQTYTITFHSNCSEISSVTYTHTQGMGDVIPPTMERDGYLFAGWYLDSACTEAITTYSSVKPYTFYAKWIARYSYTRENGGITITKLLVAEGTNSENIIDTVPQTIDGIPVLKIGEKAFSSTSFLENVCLSKNLTELGKGAFQASYLKSVTLPESLTEIPAEAFMYAPNLETVIFEGDITSIGNSAFYITTSLKNVYCSQSEEEWSKVTLGTNNSYLTKATIHYDCFYHSPTLKVCGASGNASADYTASAQDAGKALICASYLGSQLISVESVPAVEGINPFVLTDSFDTVKIFLWETLSDTVPVYDAEIAGF